ncbi:lipoprotein NlpD [Nicoletella semolina]|uniref:Lipoprotein NlpD n=1 Tax=Nicoletella semolina TaxID=271160 RepID=A0A4R2N9Z2_9PAST|nr:peptidoglycan DD-metalloendopeptidase family protein [Nicoletella semolina]MDH2925331.1 hypothetical protein [Nicoletella semolina]TCP17808.1 lipoprotein NlpD [Nicoletella semolina]
MKKSFCLIPLVAFMMVACSNQSPAPVVSASGADLAPIQPVAIANNASAGWQTEMQQIPVQQTSVQQTQMPTAMAIPQVVQPIQKPVLQQPSLSQPTVQQPVAQQAVKSAVVKPASVNRVVSQDFTIPRDEKNAPIYSQINKGFYNGESYTVRKGDTIFLIAYIAGKDVKEIAALNNLREPYPLSIGQVIKLGNALQAVVTSPSVASMSANAVAVTPDSVKSESAKPAITYTQGANGTAYGSDGTITGPVKAGVGTAKAKGGVVAVPASALPTKTPVSSEPKSSINWVWPTEGQIIAGFSASEGGNKGIDIAGQKGQAVKAAAAGRVVYAGNALQGYGNLIIIKHNDDFLSAYAHNDSIKVDEQDNVAAGQTIATLGSSGTNSNKLHFEIRYQGKSVDPTRYLSR